MHGISYLRMPPQSCRLYLGCVRFSKEEDSFPHVHYDLHFLTRFFLVSQAIVLACLKPLTRGPCLTSIHEVAAVSGRSFPTCESLRCALIAWHLGWQEWPRDRHCFLCRSYRHWFLGKWREAHFAQTSSIKSQFATWYCVHWTLTAGSWASVLPPGRRGQAAPAPSVPSWRDGKRRRKRNWHLWNHRMC